MPDPDQLLHSATRLSEAAERRWAALSVEGPARDRARQLREHLTAYVLPRAKSLDAPLIVVLLGPTGAGKSTLMNTLAGASVSRTGVLRPTTREAVLLATEADTAVLLDGPLHAVPAGRLELVTLGGREGVALVDAPDVDSVERDNRALAETLLEAADLCLFVTTASRYADQVPWDILGRVKERGLPLLVVMNRLPPDADDATAVLDDVRRLLAAAGMDQRLETVGVREGDLLPAGDALRAETVAPILRRIEDLARDREARRALAADALAGAIAGLQPLVHAIADDLEHEAIDVDALRRAAETSYDAERRGLMRDLAGGLFLREEVLRQWQTFVGADQITRFFSTGIGRVRGVITSMIRGTPSAPVAAVQEGATSDLVAIAAHHGAEAARRTAERWSEDRRGAQLIGADPALWTVSAGFGERLSERLSEWGRAIATDVQTTGGGKRALAKGASLGVNGIGVAVMVGVFAHTGGLTGAEVGVAAGTAFLNQKLLQALFGEAAMVEMIDRAKRGLEEHLGAAFGEDRARFDRLVPPADELRGLATELRTAVAAVER